MLWTKFVVVLFCGVFAYADNSFTIPDVKFEALKRGGFRAYVRDLPTISSFTLSANINKDLNPDEAGEFTDGTLRPSRGYFILQFDAQLKVGDVINYWVAIITVNKLAYRKGKLSWTVTELQDSYSTRRNCKSRFTIVNGKKSVCAGQPILEDNFDGSSIDSTKWIVEHRIPTYSEPSYEFNSYQNDNSTVFFKNGKIHLKPIASKNENDVRGSLDLREGCTSDDEFECLYHQAFSFILPPVKSAKITSKTSFKYGKVEIRAKLPAGDWIFPVIQLDSKEKVDTNSSKIWIAYSRGNEHFSGNDNIDTGSTLLFAGPVLHPHEPIRSRRLVSRRHRVPYNDEFHVYTLEWLPDKMQFYFDGELYGTVIVESNSEKAASDGQGSWSIPKAPVDQEYVLSLGVAVGGFIDFPDHYMSGNNPKPWINWERISVKRFFEARNVWLNSWRGDVTDLQVDYVKILSV